MLHSLTPLIVKGVVFENCQVLIPGDGELNFYLQPMWLPAPEV